ncbi:hypothetical protein E2C01_019457 [Portunus trituberculatus]|uniref:Uncharacterized protein n=1 Tax=Portunus trituberculatus TaxID=210409 RepID=A0A5B7DX93_PORTR|nr:hypothetical protein [Portunus trituberculatus]
MDRPSRFLFRMKQMTVSMRSTHVRKTHNRPGVHIITRTCRRLGEAYINNMATGTLNKQKVPLLTPYHFLPIPSSPIGCATPPSPPQPFHTHMHTTHASCATQKGR